tara:strand:+ start:79 stop:408 length:330 start_codon:yes stop_codon:yes gene_type:complete
MRHNNLLNVKHGDTMIKQITIKLGATAPTEKKFESARADIEATFSIKDEHALDLEKSMETYQYELRRARVMLRDAIQCVKDELKGSPLEDQKTRLTPKEKDQLRKLLGD